VRRRFGILSLLTVLALAAAQLMLAPAPAGAAAEAPRCSTAGTWKQGELNVYWFDVEQGDSQLIVGPTGRTVLVDLAERAWNATSDTTAELVADRIRTVCGIAGGPVHLDYVLASHHHLDHIGYPGNPSDTTAYGNGLYRLLHPDLLGFTVGQLLDRDAGTWTDSNRNGSCEVGTSSEPSNEVAWHNAGTTSQTSRRFICWLYGPDGQRDRAHIQGKVVRLSDDAAFPSLDLGTGVSATIVQANAKGVLQADGVTPVSGDHTTAAVPPSENDYSVALRVQYGDYVYGTAGDSDGEYAQSSFGYTYNDVEASLVAALGDVSTVRANHHGSSHSTSTTYVAGLAPETAVISCGANSYGHPANRVLQAFADAQSDTFLTNNPCDTTDGTGAAIDYTGTFNRNGDLWLATTSAGSGYTVAYDAGSRSYTSAAAAPAEPTAGVGDVQINEYLMAPKVSGSTEWIELYNPTGAVLDISGLWIDDVADAGGAPKQIPAGTSIAAGGRWVMDVVSGFLNNTGSEAVRLLATDKVTVYDSSTYSLASTRYDQVFHRIGDGGSWCADISSSLSKGTANPVTCP
jgi:beta-lactamase superfamily II metal-dependent hydrolase